MSTHELWTVDDIEEYIDAKVLELGPNDNTIAPCPKKYTPVVYDITDYGYKENKTRSCSWPRRGSTCSAGYAVSGLIGTGEAFVDDAAPLPSEKSLSIVFDESLDLPDRVTLGYNKEGLRAWHDSKFTEDQVSAW